MLYPFTNKNFSPYKETCGNKNPFQAFYELLKTQNVTIPNFIKTIRKEAENHLLADVEGLICELQINDEKDPEVEETIREL